MLGGGGGRRTAPLTVPPPGTPRPAGGPDTLRGVGWLRADRLDVCRQCSVLADVSGRGRSRRYVGPAELKAAFCSGGGGRRIGSAADFSAWIVEQSAAEPAQPFPLVIEFVCVFCGSALPVAWNVDPTGDECGPQPLADGSDEDGRLVAAPPSTVLLRPAEQVVNPVPRYVLEGDVPPRNLVPDPDPDPEPYAVDQLRPRPDGRPPYLQTLRRQWVSIARCSFARSPRPMSRDHSWPKIHFRYTSGAITA